MKNLFTRLTQSIRARAGKVFTAQNYSFAWLAAYGLAFVATPAHAQSIHDTGVSIFEWIYGIVGVVGGISMLVSAINWKAGNFLGVHNPKAMFFNAFFGTAIGFAVPSIILAIKGIVNTTGSGSSL
ncbi:TPA: hypothetical protein ACK3Q6_004458 [Burkholderia cepacia]